MVSDLLARAAVADVLVCGPTVATGWAALPWSGAARTAWARPRFPL